MAVSKVIVNIAGNEFCLNTEDDPAYVESLAAELSKELTNMLENNSSMSITQAAILSALNTMDDLKKNNNSADSLRGQIKDYLEDSARARMEAESAKREVERLTEELNRYRK